MDGGHLIVCMAFTDKGDVVTNKAVDTIPGPIHPGPSTGLGSF